MTVEALLLAATTLIAVVAVVIAVVAVRAVRRLSAEVAAQALVEAAAPATSDHEVVSRLADARTSTTEPRVVQGRVIVPPTQAQVVRTALGRPGVRLSVFAHGVTHALRAENRDRIIALMRREYRHRRRERLRAGRQAIRMARPNSAPSTERLHAQFAETRALSITERMVSS